jgi:sorbitol-specific phosphotransferase system component IIC
MAESSRTADIWTLIGIAAGLVTWQYGLHGFVVFFAAASLVNGIIRAMEKS